MAKKAKFLVVSYDDDQQQGFWDLVVAKDEEEAKELVGYLRDYAVPVDVLTEYNLRVLLMNVNRQSLAEAEREFQEQLGEVTADEVEADLALEEGK